MNEWKRQNVTIDDVIEYLNSLVSIDAPAMAALIENRVPCNQELAYHPTVQCDAQHGGYWVRMLGIINGMFGVNSRGGGPIMFVTEDGNLTGFARAWDDRDDMQQSVDNT